MMRNLGGILLVLALLAVFLVPGWLHSESPVAQATAPQVAVVGANTGTPAYFPMVFQAPSPTPTPTATNTPTPPPTATQTPYVVSTGHLSGNIYWKEGRNRYYMNIEWIKFMQWIFNDSTNTIERYKLTGVSVQWPDGHSQFHTSITGAPDYVAPRCFGPNGNTLDWTLPLRCGSDMANGQHEDHIGAASDISVNMPGLYTLQYNVCQSTTVEQCQSGGEWHRLGTDLQFIADPPPATWTGVIPAPLGTEICQLIMTDESHGRLDCVPRQP